MASSAHGEWQACEAPSFEPFQPLLEACKNYIQLSGSRFRSRSFDGIDASATGDEDRIPVVSEARSRDPGPRLAAKLKAAPAVAEFTARLQGGDELLHEELRKVHQLVASESLRNVLIGVCREHGIFPPSPCPEGVDEQDCAYEDTSASPPVRAQRLYNSEVQRLQDVQNGIDGAKQRAKKAAFLLEFAEGVGVVLPSMPDWCCEQLEDFQGSVSAWAAQTMPDKGKNDQSHSKLADISSRVDHETPEVSPEFGDKANGAVEDASIDMARNVVLPTAAALLVGAMGVAGTFAVRQLLMRRRNSAPKNTLIRRQAAA